MGMMGDDKGMMKGDMMGGKEMMGMHGMMRKMSEKNVVATSDGGIVVVTGNKLIKYDKDLNLVKEVDLKMDTEGMQKMMEGMKDMPPMMKGMSDGAMGAAEKPAEQVPPAAAPTPASDEVDHESHH